jgi:predicted nucleic acid-binding protein
MRVYCDTSVLVAASISDHPHNSQAIALLKEVRAAKLEGVISAHGTAEFYAVLTRTPLSPPIYPSGADCPAIRFRTPAGGRKGVDGWAYL